MRKAAFVLALFAFIVISCDNEVPIKSDEPTPMPGTISINAQGGKVSFSRGNLISYLDGDTRIWDFWEKQYNYQDGWKKGKLDLYGWSIGRSNYGLELSDARMYNRDDFVDWGKNFDNSGTWRTLSSAEWSYIISGRASSVRYAKASIVISSYISTNGLIIFPDNFVFPEGITLVQTDTPSAPFTSNTLSVEMWDRLDPLGCVFLPAGGYGSYMKGWESTDGRYRQEQNEHGYYWSSDIDVKVSTFHRPYCLHFSNDNVEVAAVTRVDEERRLTAYGRLVRLVTDCQ